MAGEVMAAASWQEKATERIRGVFVDLIPEDDLKKMITAEFQRFTNGYREHGTDKPGELQTMIRLEIRAFMLAKVKDALGRIDLEGEWSNIGFQPSEFIKTVAKEAAPELLGAMFGGIIRQAVQDTKQSLAKQAQNRY